jgi:hypothetical protein
MSPKYGSSNTEHLDVRHLLLVNQQIPVVVKRHSLTQSVPYVKGQQINQIVTRRGN